MNHKNIATLYGNIESTWIQKMDEYIDIEWWYLNTCDLKNKVIYDIWAGYWRILKYLRSYIAYIWYETEESMYNELIKKWDWVTTSAVRDNFIHHLEYWSISNGFFLLAQNTLGTIQWDRDTLIKLLSQDIDSWSEVIISVFKKETLKCFWLPLYTQMRELVWEINYKESDLEKGELVTETWYTSHWFSDSEIDSIISSFWWTENVIADIQQDHFRILHLWIK